MDLPIYSIIFLMVLVALFFLEKISEIKSHAKSLKKEAVKKANKEKIQSTPDFTISNSTSGCNNTVLAYDETRKKICFFENTDSAMMSYKVFSCRDILSAEIIENGETVTKTETKSKSRLGRAVVGGVLFGGAGAVLGGLTGKSESASTSTNFVTQIDLKSKRLINYTGGYRFQFLPV